MIKLKTLIKESQNADYNRMNIGGKENEAGMTNEEKRAFLEAVASYHQLGEMISHKGNLSEIHENIKTIVENASSLTIKETGDWFDRVTVQRHMKSMNESYKVFSNSINEVVQLQQRLESAYDEIGEVLGKYYEIKEGNTFGAERAKAIAGNEDSFEVDGKSYKVTGVDAEDKKNAEEFANESMKLTSLIKRTEELTGKQHKLDIDGDGEIEASDLAALRAGKKKEESVNEEKYTVIDPKGNSLGTADKTQVMMAAKKRGGAQSGFFVVSAKNALKAKRALEKFKGDFRNPKLKNMMSNLFYESVNEGKKRFKQQDGIGSSKYTISYHDGKKKHKDGSDFFDIQIFKNKPELEAFKKDLVSKGFVSESVNETFIPKVGRIDDYKLKDLLMKNPKVNAALGDGEKSFMKKSDVVVIMHQSKRFNTIFTDGKQEFEIDMKVGKLVKPLGKARKEIVGHFSKSESVNEASRRATDFYGDSKHGKALHSLLKGKWDSKKVEKFLDKLGDGNDVKYARAIDFISGNVGLNIRKYKTIGEQLPELMKALETLYTDFLTESITESHFKVGDKVKMSHGGIGVVKSLDKADGADDEKYYNIQLPTGDVMKHAPNELKLVESQTKKTSMLLKTLMDK